MKLEYLCDFESKGLLRLSKSELNKTEIPSSLKSCKILQQRMMFSYQFCDMHLEDKHYKGLHKTRA